MLFSFLCLISFPLSAIYAQNTGQIQGNITDQETGAPLIGANVYLEGTSLGASTDFSGRYVINRVPVGSYQVSVRYIGYEEEGTTIKVGRPGEVVRHDFMISPKVLEGQEVVITAQAMGQRGAINQQLASNTIINVVSSEKIHQLPDDNASTALSRLPGISLQDGDKVVIRGVQAKLNTVLINGIQVPSTDMDDRSTNLGFISSNLLSGIEVIKALTPDMDANTIGGVVNLRLREAPAGFHLDLFSQGNYNTLDRTADNYKLWASVSNRFFDDKLGIFIQGNADRSNIGQDVVTASFGIRGVGDILYGEAPYQMDSYRMEDQWNEIENAGASVIVDYVLPKGKIVLQNTYTHNLSNNTFFQNLYSFDVSRGSYAIDRDKYEKDLLINALQAEYNLGGIKTELSLSHSYSDKNTLLRYGDGGAFMSFHNPDPHPYGRDAEGNAIQYPNARQFFTIYDALDIPKSETDANDATVQGWVVGREEAFKQHVYNATLDFSVPITLSKYVSSEIKFGGKFTKSTRTNDVESYFNGSYDVDYYYGTKDFFPDHPGLSPQNPVRFSYLRDFDYKRGDYFLNGDYPFRYAYDRDLMDRYMETSIAGWQPARHMPYSNRDDFDGTETFSAGYLMGDFRVGPRLSLIGGLRYEHYNMDYNGKFVICTHSVYGYGFVPDTLNTVDRNDVDLFPNAHLRYKLTDWFDVRLAYTKGISRPDYRAILPSVYYEPGGYAWAGNSNLKPAISTNYDAILSFYTNEIGLFTVGGFYKKIDNTFFQTDIYFQNLSNYNVSFPGQEVFGVLKTNPPGPSQIITTYINSPNPAYVRGVELEWQTNFWYLPKPFNSVVLDVNYTRSWSDMDYQQIRNRTITSRDPVTNRPRFEYVTTDTIRNARLLHQGNHNLNLALGIDYKGFSGRISFNLQGDVVTNIGNRPEADNFTGNVYKWDFALRQRLPIEGFSVSLSGVNIFNNPVYTYRHFRRSLDGDILRNMASIRYSPRIFQASIRYSY